MIFAELALAMIVALPGPTPEHAEEIADAIAEASGGNRLVAAELTALGFYESGFQSRIQAGECRKHECDRGRARTYFQFQRTSWSRDAWESSVGLEPEAILEASKVAAKVLRAGRRACGPSPEAHFSFYAIGRCEWKGAYRRARLARSLMAIH